MYWIVTDSGTDLPKSYIDAEENFLCVPITITLDGRSVTPDGSIDFSKEVYRELRAGKVITTAQINSEGWKDAFRPILEKGGDILAIIFSGGLSGTYHAAELAAEELRAEFPERRLHVIDSRCASMGEGLLVHLALQNRKAGMTVDENEAWVRAHVPNLVHWFTVDDLMFLRRGGRVSAASAYLGTMVKIKPILNVDIEGHLIPHEKVQGRKRSIHKLLEKVKEHITDPASQTIFISHGDCEEEAQTLADMVKAEIGVKDVFMGYIGPVIGSHAGPGTIAIFFLGDERG